MNSDFPGITINLDAEALIIHTPRPMLAISSSVTGGGILSTRYIVNMHVDKNYNSACPADDLVALAQRRGIAEPFQGLMTAVYLEKTKIETLCEQGITVTALMTAGIGNASCAGISAPAAPQPGTINTILLVDANLTPAALVNAVMIATEAKTATLYDQNTHTTDGLPATGTSSDAICIACTGRGEATDYAGAATLVGWLIARTVRYTLKLALSSE
jgi:adenosylcobinamide hydrolase